MAEAWRTEFNHLAQALKGQPEPVVKQALQDLLNHEAPDFAGSDSFLSNAAKLIATGFDYQL